MNMSPNAMVACGKRARIPMLITREMPLPIPRSGDLFAQPHQQQRRGRE